MHCFYNVMLHYCHLVTWRRTISLSDWFHNFICSIPTLYFFWIYCVAIFWRVFVLMCCDGYSAEERPAAVESAGEDEGCEARCWDAPSGPLSTGYPTLDHTLLVHLKNCSSQLLVSYCSLIVLDMDVKSHIQGEQLQILRMCAEFWSIEYTCKNIICFNILNKLRPSLGCPVCDTKAITNRSFKQFFF